MKRCQGTCYQREHGEGSKSKGETVVTGKIKTSLRVGFYISGVVHVII